MSAEDVAKFLSLMPNATEAQARHYIAVAGGDVEVGCAIFCSEVPPSTTSAAKPPPKAVAPSTAPRKQQEYFAGGAPSSGVALVAAPDSAEAPNDSDLVSGIINKAKEGGEMQPANASSSFQGGGRRLGHTAGASPVVQTGVKEEKTIKIAFYKNGFLVEGEDFKDITVPENKAFLETLHRGIVPKEIAQRYPNAAISIAVADHHDEEYKSPFKAFQGTGNSLQPTSSSSAPSTAKPTPMSSASAQAIVVDASLPVSVIPVQLLDGRRVEVSVNPGVHTVGALHSHVTHLIQTAEGFQLWVRDMPPRRLTDVKQTLEDAKCNKAVVFAKKG
jgi:UBX domain-containing protein 1